MCSVWCWRGVVCGAWCVVWRGAWWCVVVVVVMLLCLSLLVCCCCMSVVEWWIVVRRGNIIWLHQRSAIYHDVSRSQKKWKGSASVLASLRWLLCGEKMLRR